MIRALRTHMWHSAGARGALQTRSSASTPGPPDKTAQIFSRMVIAASARTAGRLPLTFRRCVRRGIEEAGHKNFRRAIQALQTAQKYLPKTSAHQAYHNAIECYIDGIKGNLQLIRNAEAFLKLPYDKNLKKLRRLNGNEEQIEWICQAAHYLISKEKLPVHEKGVIAELRLPSPAKKASPAVRRINRR